MEISYIFPGDYGDFLVISVISVNPRTAIFRSKNIDKIITFLTARHAKLLFCVLFDCNQPAMTRVRVQWFPSVCPPRPKSTIYLFRAVILCRSQIILILLTQQSCSQPIKPGENIVLLLFQGSNSDECLKRYKEIGNKISFGSYICDPSRQ